MRVLFFILFLSLPAASSGNHKIFPQGSRRDPSSFGRPKKRHLILCLDGVGFETLEKLIAQGRFRSFQKPSRLIAPFPTISNLGLVEILLSRGASKARGYEDYYYHPPSSSMRGGILARFRDETFIKGTYRELFDFHPTAMRMTLEYAAPPLSSWLEAQYSLKDAVEAFEHSEKEVFLAYNSSTDPLAHVGGEEMLTRFLASLEASVERLLKKYEGSIDVTLVSDHGNHFRDYRKISLIPTLEAAGFQVNDRINNNQSIVQPRYGLIGVSILYTDNDNKKRAAEIVAKAPGVDFALYKEGETVFLVGKNGRSSVERKNNSYRYKVVEGDPLKLKPIWVKLKKQGFVDREGFVPDAYLFQATQDHAYPDCLRRLWQAMTNHVEYPASVLASLEDGFYDGSDFLNFFANLKATHGNLLKGETEGIVLTTERELPASIRASDFWKALGFGTDTLGVSVP